MNKKKIEQVAVGLSFDGGRVAVTVYLSRHNDVSNALDIYLGASQRALDLVPWRIDDSQLKLFP